MHEWSLVMEKKYMIIIITADNEDNWNKAADKKEKKYQKINESLLTRQAVVHRLNHYNLTYLLSQQCFYVC